MRRCLIDPMGRQTHSSNSYSDEHWEAIKLEAISCDFPGVRALDGVSLEFLPGEVHALAGENGAGKSTLLKVLAGLVLPATGKIHIGDRAYDRIDCPLELGIRTIPQEPVLAPDLSVVENLFLGHLPRGRWGWVDWTAATQRAKPLLARVGLNDLSPQTLVNRLGLAEQQLVEIARALAGEGRVYLFDEPTSCLSGQEVANLAKIIDQLRRQDKIVLYVSHRLNEVFSFCQRVSVLRDGKLMATRLTSETSPEEVIRLMVGREWAGVRPPAPPLGQSKTRMRVEGLTLEGVFHQVQFELQCGEILGIGGLVGAGRTELLQTLFGITPPSAGLVTLNGTEIRIQSPRDAIAAGIALVPEDRKRHGLALNLSVVENFALPNLDSLQRLGLIRHRKAHELALQYAQRMNLRYRRLSELALLLSGGNQQKIVLGKWLARKTCVLLLDEPTRGIDVAAKAEIYRLIRELASTGMSILLVSSELPELLALSDRVLVMCEGSIAGELTGAAMTEESILQLATPGYQKSVENATSH